MFCGKDDFFFVLKKIFKRRKMADMDKMTNWFFFLYFKHNGIDHKLNQKVVFFSHKTKIYLRIYYR